LAQSGVFTVKRGANAERVVYIKKSGTGAHRACRMQSFCEHAPTDVLREKKCLEAPGQVELDKADLRYAELDEVLVGDVPDRDHQVAACVGLPSLAARNGEAREPPSPPVARPFVNHPLEKRVWRRARRPASDETRTRVVRFPIDGLHGYL
jgi:hypothetical protein